MAYRPTKQEVREARIAAGLTQTAAGELVGVGLKQWQHFESGHRVMRPFSWRTFLASAPVVS